MGRKQIVVISIAFLLIGILFSLPKSTKVIDAVNHSAEKTADDILNNYVKETKSGLDSINRLLVEGVERSYEKSSELDYKLLLLDSLTDVWGTLKKPILSAFYSEKKIALNTSSENIKSAADNYFYATHFAEESLRLFLFEKASNYYSLFLENDSTDNDVLINLGVCYLEGYSDPMKGVAIIKKVLEKDPNNIKANLNLGYFSIKSGQYEKAIERFEKVIEIDSHQAEAYLHLGEVYENKGDLTIAIEYYSKYKDEITDTMVANKVQNYITKLKNKL